MCRGDPRAGGGRIEAPAPSGVESGEGCPLPSRISFLGERRELPRGPGRSPGHKCIFCIFYRPQNASRRKMWLWCSMNYWYNNNFCHCLVLGGNDRDYPLATPLSYCGSILRRGCVSCHHRAVPMILTRSLCPGPHCWAEDAHDNEQRYTDLHHRLCQCQQQQLCPYHNNDSNVSAFQILYIQVASTSTTWRWSRGACPHMSVWKSTHIISPSCCNFHYRFYLINCQFMTILCHTQL